MQEVEQRMEQLQNPASILKFKKVDSRFRGNDGPFIRVICVYLCLNFLAKSRGRAESQAR